MEEYKEIFSGIKSKFKDVITEADSNIHKWLELFVDQGQADGTLTIETADTFDKVIANFEQHAQTHGAANLFIDIWEDSDQPVIVKCLWDKNEIYDILAEQGQVESDTPDRPQ